MTERALADTPRVLVIGYGNPGRQDDGLGPAVALAIEHLGGPRIAALDAYQLNIEDAIDIADHDVVWFVDASLDGPEPFAVHTMAPAASIEFTSHILRPEALLAIARQMFGATPEAHLLAIRGYDFEFIEGLTARATDNLAAAVSMLTGRLGLKDAEVRL
jgi:hydrogenase maturation protease